MRRMIVGGLAVAALAVALPVVAATPQTRSDPDFKGRTNPIPREIPEAGGICTTPPPVVPPGGLSGDVGNTCTPGSPNAVNNYGGTCAVGLPVPFPGPEHIYQVNLGPGNNPSFSADLTGSTGDLVLLLVNSATCGNGTNCVAHSKDFTGPGVGPETIPAASYAPGTYFLYIDSYYAVGSANSCGSYSLTITPPLPVELIDFTIG